MQTDRAQLTMEAPADNTLEPMLTADEVAAALGVNRKFVYARHHAGELRGYKLGPHYRFRPTDVRAYIEASFAPADSLPLPREPRRTAPTGTFRALLEGRAG